MDTPLEASASIKSIGIDIASQYQDTNDMGQDLEDREELMDLRRRVSDLQA